MPICIYCKNDKPAAEFNREHVVPAAFGSFKDSLVLHQTVCRECNDHFGRTLDRSLARESPEGFERFQWGTKSPHEVGKLRYTHVRLSADVPGDFNGCLLELREDPKISRGVKAFPMPQVGLSKVDSDGFLYIPLSEFESGVWLNDPSIDASRGVRVIEANEDVVKKALEGFGIELKQSRPMTSPPEDANAAIDQIVRITHDHLRGIAKIAFNYLAYVHGSAFALRSEFDSTRRYIRYGTLPFLPAVHLSEHEIFSPPGGTVGERAVAHMLTITVPTNAEVTLGQVTLYNWMRYDVVLAHSVLPDLIVTGHIFEPRSKTIARLGRKT